MAQLSQLYRHIVLMLNFESNWAEIVALMVKYKWWLQHVDKVHVLTSVLYHLIMPRYDQVITKLLPNQQALTRATCLEIKYH